ncbi:DUF6114 domain-containing protein [Streptoalloteichus tenebrarius]|uniref:DUF6114 domain-containing protein n=1 Tax=Streptoalloteichus tenebrarius (strain ATCC 17920 / DSM 40477 / JCM 4838 / CBS 697.72 / NBRC 16177 / NCIMB 11028 / NRRL B-12390 / A12253. 1 / ISP 5477) TaxID=1933 RepID=UPI0020A57F13|nr:DUF6114 domain-containing protein [Streptoalloteichus tenebrarius]
MDSAGDSPPAGTRPPSPRVRFRRWRPTRLFWAGLVALLAAAEILTFPVAGWRWLLVQGLGGVGVWGMGLALGATGLLLWACPARRRALGPLTLALAFGSYLVANLGGFLVGMALALVSGALALAWRTTSPPPLGEWA